LVLEGLEFTVEDDEITERLVGEGGFGLGDEGVEEDENCSCP
jgi:hypothetical protein